MNSETFTGKLLLSAEGRVSRMQCNSLLWDWNGIYTGVGRNCSVGIDSENWAGQKVFPTQLGFYGSEIRAGVE